MTTHCRDIISGQQEIGDDINERYNEYEPDELERLLRESQKDKFETSSIHKNYLIAISDGLNSLSIPMRKVIIEYAKENNLEITN